jgi:uncharacterized membrane protein YfcA
MTPLDWMIITIGALLVGLGKGGLVGVGNLTVVLFAMVFEAKASVGLLLPVLISADIVAIVVYRRHADWRQLWHLLPWMFAGCIVGFLLFGQMSDLVVRRLIGGIVLFMTVLQIGRTLALQRGGGDFAERLPHSLGFRSALGLTGGFATMVANAAGPVGHLYFISVGLPKIAFIGTSAWCFFIINLSIRSRSVWRWRRWPCWGPGWPRRWSNSFPSGSSPLRSGSLLSLRESS